MCTLAIRGPLEGTVLPDLELTGTSVSAVWEPTTILRSMIDGGVRADVLVAVSSTVSALSAQGTVEPTSCRPLASVGVGVAVAPGTSAPSLGDEGTLRKALLEARSVAYSRSGASGRYFVSLLDRLGIREEVEARATQFDKGFTATALFDGRADLAIQQVSELAYVKGAVVVGALPASVQQYTEFTVARFTDRNSDAAHALYNAILAPEASPAYLGAGLNIL